MNAHLTRLAVPVAVLAALLPAGTAAGRSASVNPCTLLSAKQVAAVHVGSTCKVVKGNPNPYYSGVSGIWGTPGKGVVAVDVNRVFNHAYIAAWEAKHTAGKSIGVGSWSRGAFATGGGCYCYFMFVVGDNVVVMQVSPPKGHPMPSSTPAIAMAKSIAAKL